LRGIAPRGKLVVTDFAIVRADEDCPRQRLRIEEEILIEPGKPLYFWFRFEGGLVYLDDPVSNRPVDFVVVRGNGLIEELIKLDAVHRGPAREEALNNAGFFDWRMTANKTNFFVPGIYYIELRQGRSPVCFRLSDNLPEQEVCRLTLMVR
jgi:hypothetical protein